MSEYAFFYNSENGDRKYNADSFEQWLKKFFTTGVFTGDLIVQENSGMTVRVGTGYTNIEGKVKVFNTEEILPVENADPTYNRIDTVVVERNDTERDFILKIVKGGYASNPIETPPIRTAGIYQIVLAEIYVAAGATAIMQSAIRDMRTDKSVCGLVTGTVEEMDFEQFTLQFESYFEEFKGKNLEDFERFKQENMSDFMAWFDRIKGQLSEDAAGHLQNQIDDVEEQIKNLKPCFIRVSCDEEFIGNTIDLIFNDEVVDSAEAPYSLIVEFGVKELGTYTISSGEYSADVVVDNYTLYTVELHEQRWKIEDWLQAGRVTKSFSSLEEILADQTTLRQLMTIHASADYMLEWLQNDEVFRSALLGSDNALKWIGLRDYTYDKLPSDFISEWLAGEYWERALKDHVPVMTSNTAPYGEIFESGHYGSHYPYNLFSNSTDYSSLVWSASAVNGYVGYSFANPINVRKIGILNRYEGLQSASFGWKLQGSNDKSTWTDLLSFTETVPESSKKFKYRDVNTNNYYLHFRVLNTSSTGGTTSLPTFARLQFYGRSLDVSVPAMTSDTAPYGEASCGGGQIIEPAWKSFSGANTNSQINDINNPYVQFDFKKQVVVKQWALANYGSFHAKAVTLSGSNDGSKFTVLDTRRNLSMDDKILQFSVSNTTPYRYYKISNIEPGYPTIWTPKNLQFYGVDYSEREFASGSTIKYLYDHGVEFENFTLVKNPSSVVASLTKNENSMVFTKTTTSSGTALAHIETNSINLTSYKLVRLCVGDKGFSGNEGLITTSASKKIEAIDLPNNVYLNIANVNQSDKLEISCWASASTSLLDIAECWLE